MGSMAFNQRAKENSKEAYVSSGSSPDDRDEDSTTRDDADSEQQPEEAVERGKRPTGMQRAKLDKMNLALYSRQVKAAEQMALNAEKRNRLAEEQIQLNLFNMKPAADDIQANEFLQLKRELVLQTLRAEISGVPRLHPHSTADPELCRFAITADTSTLLVAVAAVPDTHTSPHIATAEDTDKTNPNAEEGQSSTNTSI